MRLSEQFLYDLKNRNDIVSIIGGYVDLKKRGKTSNGLCPFHGEKTPSFTVYDDTQSYYCFGCQNGGDVITFIMNIENLDYIEAVKFLADRSGLVMPADSDVDDYKLKLKKRAREANKTAALHFYKSLYEPEGKEALDYLYGRGFTDNTIKKWGLGYAKNSFDELIRHLTDSGFKIAEIAAAGLCAKSRKNNSHYSYFRNRIIFPIIDIRGEVIGFGGRVCDNSKPKYLNTADTELFKKHQNLYGMNFAKNTKQSFYILSEGYADTIAIARAGFDNVVATLGTALSKDQAMLLKRYTNEIVIAYDMDEAGRKATDRSIEILKEAALSVRVLRLDRADAKDPDEYIKKYGRDRFAALIEKSGGSVSYMLSNIKNKYDIDSDEGKAEYLKAVAPMISRLSIIERDIYISKVAKETDVSKSAIEQQVAAISRRNQKREENKQKKVEIVKKAPNKIDRINPEKAKYGSAVSKEEYLIAAVMKNPDFTSFITLETFITEFNTDIVSRILEIINEYARFDISLFGDSISQQKISYLMRLQFEYSQIDLSEQSARDVAVKLYDEKNRLILKGSDNDDYISELLEQKRRQDNG